LSKKTISQNGNTLRFRRQFIQNKSGSQVSNKNQ